MHFEVLAALFAVAVCAGIVDGIAGGGGLITLPALLIAGLPPASALATNKIQALSSVASSAFRFIRAGYIDGASVWGKIALSLAGAGAGAYAIRTIDPVNLAKVAPLLLICVALFFLFSHNLVRKSLRPLIQESLFGWIAILPISFYDGFFGPGTGAIYVAAFALLLGRALPRATAEAKILNTSGSLIAALIFLQGAIIVWPAAIAMVAGGMIGGHIGAGLAIKWGAPFIRIALVIVSIALALRLILQQTGRVF